MDRIPDPVTSRGSSSGRAQDHTVVSGLVADAVAQELREVLGALGLEADVTVRRDTDPVLVSSGASAGVEDPLRLRKWGPAVVVDLPLGEGAVLAQVLTGHPEGQRHG